MEIFMLKGVFPATKIDGTIYYRSSINYSGKHISLGSFSSEDTAHLAYKEASQALSDSVITIDNVYSYKTTLPYEKIISGYETQKAFYLFISETEAFLIPKDQLGEIHPKALEAFLAEKLNGRFSVSKKS